MKKRRDRGERKRPRKCPPTSSKTRKQLSFPLLEDDKLWKQERERHTVSGHKDRPLIKTSERKRERGEERRWKARLERRGRRAKEVKRSWGESAASNRPDDGVWGHGWAVAGLVSDQSRGEEQLCSSICPFYAPPSTGWEETIVRTWSIVSKRGGESFFLLSPVPFLRFPGFITWFPFSQPREKCFSSPFAETMKLISHFNNSLSMERATKKILIPSLDFREISNSTWHATRQERKPVCW